MTFGVSAQQYMKEDTVNIYTENKLNPATKSLRVPVDFNDSKLLAKYAEKFKSLTIERVDLVYTTFRESPDFDQIKLNQNRLKRFKKSFPELDSPLIQWNIIGQSSAVNAEQAKKLYHGFVIYYRPKPTKESIENEISFMDSLLGESTSNYAETEKIPTNAVAQLLPVAESDEKLETDIVEYSDRVEEEECLQLYTGKINATAKEFSQFKDSIMSLSRLRRLTYTEIERPDKNVKSVYNYEYLLLKEGCYEGETPIMHYETGVMPVLGSWFQNADYDAVRATFERNPQWQNSLVVIDVTGSMSPYIGKTMAWVKATQDSSQIGAFVFFNDGDNTPDYKKRTGNVGGIYSVSNETFSSVYSEMKSTMRKGGGGDCPENNVEATIKGIDEFPECDEIIMVADNWATPRDMKYASQLNKPVHVIICGGSHGINEAYVQLAYDTKGSVHTIEEDLNMRDIKPGKQFKVGSSYFTLVKGKIVRAQHK